MEGAPIYHSVEGGHIKRAKIKSSGGGVFWSRVSPSSLSFTYVDKKEKIGGWFLADQLCRNLFPQTVPPKQFPKSIQLRFPNLLFFFFFSTVIIFGTTDPRHRIGITNIRPSIKLLFILLFLFFLPPLFLWGTCGCFLALLLSCMVGGGTGIYTAINAHF